ncbi:thiamine diphosphokinase [Pseudaestuariivita atlantica]|uniref:Thiamine diphosphokinase n=1 Tax=Pseudaestuariivita atlantica TaxID=1317121 RepID=A0A0L1JM97_9RHOB|nr:thiamine diphosphokinase [Pseudaestuariivita atlantica]KNG92881.1 hypothetical protein ATO11_15605 [Pseudaestuariivita atlantica]
MSEELVHTDAPVLLVGAGKAKARDIHALRDRAGLVVAADGGALTLDRLGIVPDRVIGDMDSLPEGLRARLDPGRVHEIAEQDSTDFEKCLSRINAPLVLAAGFLGRRMDHSLAALSGLVRHAATPCVLVGARDVIAHVPDRLTLDVDAGTRVSLYPLAEVRGRGTGLHWPIDGLTLSPMGRIGTSNRATGPVTLEMEGAGCLVLLPRSCLDALVRGLAG